MNEKVIINHNCFDNKYKGEIAEVLEEYNTKYYNKIIVKTKQGNKVTLYKDDVDPIK